MLPDNPIKERIEEAIERDERICLQPIQVLVEDGIVTLNGSVRSNRRKQVAFEVAASFEGCRDVVNNLSVDPEALLTDTEITKHIKLSLNACADVTVDAVHVSVTDGMARLRGAVRSQWEQLVAEDVARSIRGVRDVENRLAIDPLAEVDQEEVAKEITTALGHARDLKGTDIGVQFSGSSVVLLGEVSLLTQKETAEVVIRRFGFQHIRNDIRVTR